MVVKIYGERNSGTIYLHQLIEKNLHLPILKYKHSQLALLLMKYEIMEDFIMLANQSKFLGWKHGCPPINAIKKFKAQELGIITITKNPYSFLLSLHKQPYHNREVRGLNFSDFIHHPWQTLIRDRLKRKRLTNPVILWNEKNKAYLELQKNVSLKIINLSYEELIKHPEKSLDNIANELGVGNKIPNFENITVSTKNGTLDFHHYQSYYLKEQWRELLTPNDINYINQYLNEDVMKVFGYKKI